MKEKSKSLASHALLYCLFPAAAMFIYAVILNLFGIILFQSSSSSFNSPTYLLPFIIPYIFLISGMAFGTLRYRKQFLNGFMSYSKAFKSCFLIGLFCMILVLVISFIYYTYIDPGIQKQYNDIAMKEVMAQAHNMTDQQLKDFISMQEKFRSPLMKLLINMVSVAFISVIISLMVAIFLKKKDKSLPATV